MNPEPVGLSTLGQLLPSLALIVAALLGLRWWAQRGRSPSASPVRVLARTGLTRGAVVAVVAVGRRRLLVGASEHGVSLLTELDPDDAVGDDTPDARNTRNTPNDTVTDVTMPSLPSWTRHPVSTDGRPWMGLVRRLQHMTVRTAPSRSHPQRPFRASFLP